MTYGDFFVIMAILKTNKNNQKVFVKYFVLFMRWKARNIAESIC